MVGIGSNAGRVIEQSPSDRELGRGASPILDDEWLLGRCSCDVLLLHDPLALLRTETSCRFRELSRPLPSTVGTGLLAYARPALVPTPRSRGTHRSAPRALTARERAMFSFFRARKPTGPSAVSVLPTTVAGEWDAAPSPAEDDGGYSTVSLEGGATRPTLGGRASFSAPRASDGTFVGGHTSYPPKLDGAYAGSSTAYPALRTTFARLEGLLVDRAPTLLDSLSPPLLPSALSLQSLADTIYPYKLPRAVLEAYALHDGQDPFAANTDAQGLFYGLHWMTLDQVEAEYIIWRKFEQVGGSQGMQDHFSTSSTLYEGPNGRPHPYAADEETGLADGAGGVSMEGMRSFPEGWVRRKYSHPGWLPLITDRAGNYIGVDLDPPPPPHLARSASPSTSARRQTTFGQAGQVIAFGRELDEKVVLFPGDSAGGWGRFLAAFVEDLERGAFSRLGPRAVGDGSSPGRKVGSDSDSDWEQGDGLGDAGYLNGSRYGDEGEEDGDESPERVWCVLVSPARGEADKE